MPSSNATHYTRKLDEPSSIFEITAIGHTHTHDDITRPDRLRTDDRTTRLVHDRQAAPHRQQQLAAR